MRGGMGQANNRSWLQLFDGLLGAYDLKTHLFLHPPPTPIPQFYFDLAVIVVIVVSPIDVPLRHTTCHITQGSP